MQPAGDGLLLALESFCVQTNELYSVTCKLSYEEPLHMQDQQQATQLYYVARRQSLRPSSTPRRVRPNVCLARINGHMALTVRDDDNGLRS